MSSKDEEAGRIAQAHYRVEEGLVRIFRLRERPEIESQHGEPIKLLEINRFTVPSGILPVYFGPAPQSAWNFPLAVVEVTPDEFEQIRSQALPLPIGWIIAEPIDALVESASAS